MDAHLNNSLIVAARRNDVFVVECEANIRHVGRVAGVVLVFGFLPCTHSKMHTCYVYLKVWCVCACTCAYA